MVIAWISGVIGTLSTVIEFHLVWLLLMPRYGSGLNREALQEAYNKAIMLLLADAVDMSCPLCRAPFPFPPLP